MTVAAADGHHVWIGDRHVIQVESDDRVGAAFEQPPEVAALHPGQLQGAVGEQQLGAHCAPPGSPPATTTTSAGPEPTARMRWLIEASK